ncbi:hypothetical protein K9L97_00950 [Candidatus Woesearchaeota archaeon]|nr:hypothetical protein [Candidatus Woesearchaeota archaeon]
MSDDILPPKKPGFEGQNDKIDAFADEDSNLDTGDEYFSQDIPQDETEKQNIFSKLFKPKKNNSKREIAKKNAKSSKDTLTDEDISNLRNAFGLDNKKESIQGKFEDAVESDALDQSENLIGLSKTKDKISTNSDKINNYVDFEDKKNEDTDAWIDGSDDESHIEESMPNSASEEPYDEEDSDFTSDVDEHSSKKAKVQKNNTKNNAEQNDELDVVSNPNIYLKDLHNAAKIDHQELIETIGQTINFDDSQDKIIKHVEKEVKLLIKNKNKELRSVLKTSMDKIKKQSTELNAKIKKLNAETKKNKKEREKANTELKKFSDSLKELKKLSNDEEKMKKNKEKLKEEIVKLNEKKSKLKENLKNAEEEEHVWNINAEKAEKLFKAKQERFSGEINSLADKLSEISQNADKLFVKIEAKAKFITEKEKEYEKLVKEEEKLLEMLKEEPDQKEKNVLAEHSVLANSNSGSIFENSPDVDSEDFGEEDILHKKIDDLRQLVDEYELEDAKLLYNELVEEVETSNYAEDYKEHVRKTLKEIYEDIVLRLIPQ